MEERDPEVERGVEGQRAREEQRVVVERYFAAMRRGAEAEDEMMALFADAAVYVEPFSGRPRTSVGRDAIRATLRSGWEYPLPDLKLTVDEITFEPGRATAEWTCESPALPEPIRGRDRYVIDGGRIARLEVEFIRDGPVDRDELAE